MEPVNEMSLRFKTAKQSWVPGTVVLVVVRRAKAFKM